MGLNIPREEIERREALYEAGLKTCNSKKHREPLPLSAFAPRADGWKGLRATCTACRNEATLDYQKRTPEKQAEKQRRFRNDNPEAWRAISRRRDIRSRWKGEHQDTPRQEQSA